ncbi:DUF4263 domain-containing protein [Pseudomonas cichorii]|nr:Shedu immune nuclease family protein [Pseudomonas cichorii]MBX8508519.1 DUF4263 domain-containing protein [Pseudomonas cichorii]MBX8523821.1 DUF4263 domain-containing protein [Pseudomonas cichorii]MBX8558554.1 DUF4263 domain-containing protein [Pseudomonas cichorii]
MKTTDIVHNYPDGDARLKCGLCRVRSFVSNLGTVVLLTDLDDKNDGQSVTNAVERIIKSLHQLGIVIGPATYVEHYEKDEPDSDTFDIVTVASPGGTQWRTISREDALVLMGCPSSELDERSWDNGRIIAQADRLRFARDPFVDSHYQESHAVIKRRLEIADGLVSKAEIEALISSGPGERDIQGLLKRDLSIFGEAYAKPDDEYICFSEFPLGNGYVDFVVFTGRSRMDVILIEIKGADFNLLNSDHYKEFNHKINQAAGQLRSRLGHIYRDVTPFRDHVHRLRIQAERGEQVHNAFIGPRHGLQVDPQKDINIRTVLIGGRTVDDRAESAKRHDFERSFTPPIRIESWDTWLRRLERS